MSEKLSVIFEITADNIDFCDFSYSDIVKFIIDIDNQIQDTDFTFDLIKSLIKNIAEELEPEEIRGMLKQIRKEYK